MILSKMYKNHLLLSVILLLFSLINYSCYSYSEFSQENLQRKNPNDLVKVELKNKTELEAKVKDMNFSGKDSILAIMQKSGRKVIKLSEIKQFSEPKFDTALTIEGIVVGTIGVIIGLMFLFWVFFSGISLTG
jgi:hypothetical protein